VFAFVPLFDGADVADDTGVDFGLPEIAEDGVGLVAGGALVIGIMTDLVGGLGISGFEDTLTIVAVDW